MKKTNIKNKKLIIKKRKLLKEDWASGAVAAFSVEEMKKLATTAIFGAYEAYKRAWNTCMVLPWKLVIAFRTGQSLEDVMRNWEDRDKTLKRAQLGIIEKTGVEGTVNAFVGICNPGLLLSQKFCDYENPEMKQRFKMGAAHVWNNTVASRNPDLKIFADEETKHYDAQIVYSNFVRSICKKINIKVSQSKLSSYAEIQKSDKSFVKSIAETKSISKDNQNYRKFFKFMLKGLKDTSSVNAEIKGKLMTFSQYLDYEANLKEKLPSIESLLFEVISKSGITTSRAADIILGNNFAFEIEKIAYFIDNSNKLSSAFKNFSGGVSKPEKDNEKDSEASSEESTEKDSEAGGEEKSKDSNESFTRNIKKKTLIMSKNMLFKKLFEKKETKESEVTEDEASEYLTNMAAKTYISHMRVILAAKIILVKNIVMMKYANTYRIYNEVFKKIEEKDYQVKNIVPELYTKELQDFLNRINNINKHINSESKNNDLMKKDDEVTKALLEEFKKQQLGGNLVLKFLDERYSVIDNDVIENMINDMAKVVLDIKKEEEESKEKVTPEEILKKVEEIKSKLSNSDIQNLNNILVSAATIKSWEEFVENNLVNDQINELTNSFNKISDIKKSMDEFLDEKMKDRLVKVMPSDLMKNCLEILKKEINLEVYLDTMSSMKEIKFGDMAKNLEKLAEQLLFEKATSDSEESSDESSDLEDTKAINVSGEESLTVLVFN